MSKIQKALQAMRAARDADTITRENAEKFLSQHGPNVAIPKASVPRRKNRDTGATSRQPVLEQYVEKPVEKTVEIDLNLLREAGLWLEGSDAEVVAEQFRRAKRPLIQIAFETDIPVGENANVIMVASAMPGAGKSFCSFNLARSIARERDIGAVLVDADVLKPSLSRSLGLDDQPGLIDYLLDKSMSLEDILIQTDIHNTVVVPAGRRDTEATELLSSRRMKDLVNELSQRFRNRVVVCDTPPILVTNEAHVVAEHVGQIVLVIEARSSSQEHVLQALGSLDRDKPINAILNKSRAAGSAGYYGDDFGYYPFHGGNEDATDP